MIPEAAVEAACEAFWKGGEGDSRAFLRKALEAAAPHMLVQAWNEGHGAGQIDPYCLNGNPYDPRDRPAK